MQVRNIRWVAFAFIALSIGCILGVGALLRFEIPEARSFSLDEIQVEATLAPDGTLEVQEEVTYTFRGADSQPFTVGTRDFVLGPNSGTITKITAYQDGQPLPTLLWTPTLFEWDIAPAYSGTYTYELRYTVVGAANLGSDVVELNRQWVGTTSPEVATWSAEVHVPSGDGELRGWAHGPLDGTSEVGDDLMTATANDIPAGSFVETRLAIPVERFAVTPGEQELLPGILAQERNWAEEANANREEVAREEARSASLRRGLNVLVVPLAALAFWGFWMIWRRWGRDPKRPSDVGDYWRDVPDDPPAVVEAFLNWRQVTGAGYAATLLDLARRGQLRIEEVPIERWLRSDAIEHRFIKATLPPPETLRPFERRALDWLFADGPVITKSELVARNRSRQSESAKFWTSFKSEVGHDLDRRRYIVGEKGVPIALHLGIVVLLVAFAVVAFGVEAWIALAVAGGSALVLLPLTALQRSRTEAGTRRHAEWTALRSYLHDFSRLDEAPVGHLALWEEYLVAAVTLGVSEDLLRGLEIHHPEVLSATGGGFAPWYGVAPGHRSGGDIGAFGSDFGSAAVSSFTPQSSGSGGGGGFSGGGGGGGGGGGFGAR